MSVLDNLHLKISKHYIDGDTILDQDGFERVEVNQTAILQNYEEILGIGHWADSEDAVKELSDKDQKAIQRLMVTAPDLLRFVKSLDRWFSVEDEKWQEMNKMVMYIEYGEEN